MTELTNETDPVVVTVLRGGTHLVEKLEARVAELENAIKERDERIARMDLERLGTFNEMLDQAARSMVAEREVDKLRNQIEQLHRENAELTQQRDRLASALRFAVRHYIETPDAEAAVMAILNGYTDGKPDITHLLAA